MPRLRIIRLFSLFLLFFVSLLLTSRASAQTISVAQETSLPRIDATGQPIKKRSLSLSPEAINLQDCLDDQRIRFPIQMSEFEANATVQIWASTAVDCSTVVNRFGDTKPCWQVAPPVPLAASVAVDIPVRALLSPAGDDSACGQVDLTTIDVQILMFAPGNLDTAIVTKHVQITADTVGPEPPRASVSPGNGRVRVEVRGSASGGLTLFSSVTAYCETSSPTSCSGTALKPGTMPDPALECGTVAGGMGSALFTDPLENGTNHAVAVAARDVFGNLGPLSSVTCATPSPDAETRAQSLDEPMGCALSSAPRARDATFGTLAIAGLALLGLRRRR